MRHLWRYNGGARPEKDRLSGTHYCRPSVLGYTAHDSLFSPVPDCPVHQDRAIHRQHPRRDPGTLSSPIQEHTVYLTGNAHAHRVT